MVRAVAVGATATVAVLSSCGVGSDEADAPDVSQIASDVGCERPVRVESGGTDPQQVYSCADGGTLLIFDSATSREDYLQAATDDPSSYVTGDQWAYRGP
jgi:hypothetical protein